MAPVALMVMDVVTLSIGRSAIEQAHVGQRVDRHSDLADLALGPRMVGVVAHLCRQVEGTREARLAGIEQELEALVRGLGRAEAGVLAHRPQLRAVHRGMNAAGVGVGPRLAQLGRRVPPVEVGGPVDGLDVDTRVRTALGVGLGLLLLGRHPHRLRTIRVRRKNGPRGADRFPGPVWARARRTGQTTAVDDSDGPVFSHFGICVSDLERSLRFYCDALGFEKAESHEIGHEFARLMDFDDVAVDLPVHPARADGDRAPRLQRSGAVRLA